MKSTDKHAYLIIAHKNDLTFHTLLHLLDNQLNDIFIHMDVKNKQYDPVSDTKHVVMSNVFHTKRTNVIWGDYSQINSELILLKAASEKGNYKYYHLISGEDLPLKSQKYIHSFLADSNDEYVSFDNDPSIFLGRVHIYHFFQKIIGRHRMREFIYAPLAITDFVLVKIQNLLHIRRNRKVNFYKGANWFSITDDLARYVISQKKWIHKTFKYTYCADELFLQTLIMNSEFKNRIYKSNGIAPSLRFIDWKRGLPYIFRKSDFDSLISSGCLFARKFNSEVDSEIICMIKEHIED